KIFYMPEVASSHAHEIDMIIYLVHFLMLALLIGWGIFFLIALVRFNKWIHPKADYTGITSHNSTYIEITVVVIEALLLVGFSIPFWNKHINKFPNRPDAVEVRVVAEQFAWNIHYPGADGIFGSTSLKYFDKQSNPLGLDPDDPNGKDDFVMTNQLHLPIGRAAIIYLSSKDVMHSFALQEMRVKQDVIPGMQIPTWFTPTKTGKYEIACAQLCGLGHYRMKGFLTIHSQEDFDEWLSQQTAAAAGGDGEEYDDFWN
ncbi:MAG: hypothetical protein KC618_09420, partial [Candidatus Omnitrophica bacterium]|nr:hypothetical protein [Candidatus Omnitrophota bacterium]